MFDLLHSTCRERFLRSIDPNVPDENYSFIASEVSNSLSSWFSVDGGVKFTAVGNRFKVGYVNGLAGVTGTENSTPNPILLTGVKHTAPPSGELYVRVINWFPVNMSGSWSAPSYPLLVITDPTTNEVAFSLESVWDGASSPTAVGFKVVYKGKDGVVRTHQTPFLKKVRGTSWHDVKIFIPKDGEARIVVTEYGAPTIDLYNEKLSEGVGFGDKTGQTVSLFSKDGITPFNNAARIYRVGIGNKITTALP